jgi:hypothetical protein
MTYISNSWWEPDNSELVSHDWVVHTLRNLEWHYGLDRAVAITAGSDPATEADVAAWNRLGSAR